MSIKLTKNNYNQVVKNSDVPVLIDFYADWCMPCKMASPMVEQLSNEVGNSAKVCKVNIDNDRELAELYGVSSIPTFVLVKDNKIVKRITGFRGKNELSKMIGA